MVGKGWIVGEARDRGTDKGLWEKGGKVEKKWFVGNEGRGNRRNELCKTPGMVEAEMNYGKWRGDRRNGLWEMWGILDKWIMRKEGRGNRRNGLWET